MTISPEFAAAVGSAIIAGLVAIALSFYTTRSQINEIKRRLELEREQKKQREREKLRIQYLDPLVVAASDLLEKINLLRKELNDSVKEAFWKQTFDEVKGRDRSNRTDFALWCNGFGAGPVTMLFVTVVYFSRASRIQSELPFIQLGPQDDQRLLSKLTAVRDAFGGEHNLWVEIQDSLGEYIAKPDGRTANYKEFCMQIIDAWDHIWFMRLLDFYWDIHLKQNHELPRISEALADLLQFARMASQPHITRQAETLATASAVSPYLQDSKAILMDNLDGTLTTATRI